ncbi:MAG: DUF4255 domain-containing protein [Rhodobacteraceae bacterium]|uniref:DUF4255 domain-containing protein n=1 Tax=Amaricoccus sp. B4 TaxID=3368557 RepID=UPI0013A6A481|nr:DUF4255 domain-containing protein [Paracoccaceae bacterium]
MIDRAVSFLAARLNAHLRARFGVADDLVVAGSPADAEGKLPMALRNRLAIFVTNVSHDTMARGGIGRAPALAGRLAVNPAPVHLNIEVMLAACFDAENYLESLKILSHAIQHFQITPVFDRLSAPELDPRISQLTLEIANLSTDGASQLWGIFGGRYLPSIRYLVRTVTIDAGALVAEDLAISAPEGSARAAAGAAP